MVVAHARIETVVALHAIAEIGATFVPIHPKLVSAERERLRVEMTPALELSEREVAALLSCTREPSTPPGATHYEPQLQHPLAPFAILRTSGSSASPKDVELPRSAFVASAAGLQAVYPFSAADRWLLCMPIAHVGGLSILTRSLIARRPAVVLPSFDADEALCRIVRSGVTRLSAVPTMLNSLIERDRNNVLSRLSLVLVGGAACPHDLMRECNERGVTAKLTYGLTEACSMATVQSPRHTSYDSCGATIPGIEMRIGDDAGEPCAAGSRGRILLRGRSMMAGYHHALPPLDNNAWFDTGDLGHLDAEGSLHVWARRNDLIITGGENVSPLEVELAIAAHPGVREVAVVGVPDARWGETVAAAVVWAPNANHTLDELLSWLGPRLAAFKRPRRLIAVSGLPRLASGKLDRVAVRNAMGLGAD